MTAAAGVPTVTWAHPGRTGWDSLVSGRPWSSGSLKALEPPWLSWLQAGTVEGSWGGPGPGPPQGPIPAEAPRGPHQNPPLQHQRLTKPQRTATRSSSETLLLLESGLKFYPAVRKCIIVKIIVAWTKITVTMDEDVHRSHRDQNVC